MSMLQAEVYEAFRTLDVPDKALKAAIASSAAFGEIEDETAGSFDRRDADIGAIRRDMRSIGTDVAQINTRLATLQGDLNGRISTLQGDLNGRIAALQSEMKSRMATFTGEANLVRWMLGTVIALVVTVLFRVFTR